MAAAKKKYKDPGRSSTRAAVRPGTKATAPVPTPTIGNVGTNAPSEKTKTNTSVTPITPPTAPKIEQVSVKNLLVHPNYPLIYGPLKDASPAVQEAAKRYRSKAACLTPVVADVNGETKRIIIHGAAEVRAAISLGVKVMMVQVITCTSVADALAQLIALNQAMAKCLLDVVMEAYYLHLAEKARAKERQARGGGDQRSAKAKERHAKETVPAKSDGTGHGETRDLVAKIMGQSRERVNLMIKLAKKAFKQKPSAPRHTKIGKALRQPDADLKKIAEHFGAYKTPKSKVKPTPASGGAATSQGSKAARGPTTKGATGAPAAAHVAAELARGIKKFAHLAKDKKNLPLAAIARVMFYDQPARAEELLRRSPALRKGLSPEQQKKTFVKRRNLLLRRLVNGSPKVQDAIRKQSPEGKDIVKRMMDWSRPLKTKHVRAVIKIIVRLGPKV